MPLILDYNINSHYKIIVWAISKNDENNQIPSQIQITKDVPSHPTKKLEYIYSRHLVHLLCNSFGIKNKKIKKTPSGQPYLKEASISISHAYPFIAVGLHNQFQPIGVDIDCPKMKHLNVKHRVFSTQEIAYIHNDYQLACELWVCKESIYKCIDWRLSLKHNIIMEDVTTRINDKNKKYIFGVKKHSTLENHRNSVSKFSTQVEKFHLKVQTKAIYFEKYDAILGFTIPPNL